MSTRMAGNVSSRHFGRATGRGGVRRSGGSGDSRPRRPISCPAKHPYLVRSVPDRRKPSSNLADEERTGISNHSSIYVDNYKIELSFHASQKTLGVEMKPVLSLLTIALSVVGIENSAAQDAAAGQKTFAVCKACHQIGPTAKNFIGPVLNGVVGRKAGTYPNYAYSDANKNSGLTWDEPTLQIYLKNPRAKVPGTKMTFPGFPKETDIDNVIAYLKTIGPDGNKL